ncbi:hypothetical protein G7Y89_g7881 [Cudoniella acicularis]|uniref:Uncharacterized protein n=1 Tax=Cudoniella acicularis TaxID=354080 RepID=A0A8H4RIH2_9HELO|nr:hypothetical protein G7Y89_g7881 [Cudoniella acicularis]
MTSNSGGDTQCERCGCADNNHTFGLCEGRDGKGKRSVRCTFVWARCSTGGHNDIADVKYVDCYRCSRHPGAPPSSGDFWGSQPDDEYPIYTADELKIPWPGHEDESHGSKGKGKGKGRNDDTEQSWEAGHSRVDSGASEDPLQWTEDRYKEETGGLIEGFGNTTIDDKTNTAWSAWSAWSWSGERWERYRADPEGTYEYDHQKGSGTWSKWTWDPEAGHHYSSTRDPDGQLYYIYNTPEESSATTFTAGEGTAEKGKGRKRRK